MFGVIICPILQETSYHVYYALYAFSYEEPSCNIGKKRKYTSEDECRIQANERRRQRYAKKVTEKQNHIQDSGERQNKDSCNTDVMPVSPTDHTVVDVLVDNHVSLSALLKAKCMCFEMPVVDLSDKLICILARQMMLLNSCYSN